MTSFNGLRSRWFFAFSDLPLLNFGGHLAGNFDALEVGAVDGSCVRCLQWMKLEDGCRLAT